MTTTKDSAPLEPNHNADATDTTPQSGPGAPIVITERPPRAVLTKQQARDRIKAAGKGEDPDKIAPLDPQKAVHAAEPAEAPKPKREKPKREKKPEAPAEAKKSSPPPAAKSAPPPPAASKAKAEPPAPKAPEPPKAPAAPPPEAHQEKAELAKKRRAIDRDVKRVEARAREIQQAEQQINELFQKFDPSDPDKFMENLDAHLRGAGKDMSAAVRAWAQKKMGRPATPGQPPPPPAAPAAPPPGEDPRDQRIAELERAELKRRADAAKEHWKGHFKGELTTAPPDPTTHPTLATLDEDYLAEVMTMTAAQVMRTHKIRLDTLQLYDMIEEAEAEELAALQKKLKKQPATTGASPEREPAGTQTQKHEPSKANQPIDVSSRARAGSAVDEKPKKGKIDRDKIRAILHGRA